MSLLEKELTPLEDEVGFTHNDILVKNIIYNKDTGSWRKIKQQHFFVSFFVSISHLCEFLSVVVSALKRSTAVNRFFRLTVQI